MITIESLRELAHKAYHSHPGLGDPYLASLPPSELQAPYLRFMYKLVNTVKPEAVLECGVYIASCTAHMAAANPETMIIGIDKNMHPNMAKVHELYHNASFIIGDTVSSHGGVERMLGGRKLGIIFLDSNHDGKTPMNEFVRYCDLMADECIIACDDILGENLGEKDMIAMQGFWRWMPGDKISLNFLHPAYSDVKAPGFGVSIVRK